MIASAALRHGLPSIYLARAYAVSGGLMSYGIDLTEPYRQAAAYVDRILKGQARRIAGAGREQIRTGD